MHTLGTLSLRRFKHTVAGLCPSHAIGIPTNSTDPEKKKQFTATAVAQDVYVMGGQIWGENGAMGQGQNDQCAPLPPPCPVIAAISVCKPIELFVLLA